MLWFRHDSGANRGAKMEELLLEFGGDGYALYWLCVEIICGSIIVDDLTFEIEHDAEILGEMIEVETLRVKKIFRWLVKKHLFKGLGADFTCMKLIREFR